ncbi:hypothetical protein [Cupriavidus nantongensis]|uniref:hypothetical protein n=1 Tax=Cupriavidus nantongensis TaxID=1796606 RepID=UPI0022460022|nr:hypothetical protein [Cupriavidus nantongensis]
MRLNWQQLRIVRDSLFALVTCAVVLSLGYKLLPPALFGVAHMPLSAGDRIAFALKADLPVFLWLAGCVRAVSKGRFLSSADIDGSGSASGPPSPAIQVQVAVLQNSVEQTIMAVGAHLILATLLEGPELHLIPILVGLYLLAVLSQSKAPSAALGP